MEAKRVAKRDAAVQRLFTTLALYTKLYAKAYTLESLQAGLPISENSTLSSLLSTVDGHSIFGRAAARSGYKSVLVSRKLEDLSALHLPCLILLKDENVAILEAISDDASSMKIIFAEAEPLQEWIEIERLNEVYLGYALLLKQEYSHTQGKDDLLKTHKGHWFWDTLRLSKTIYKDVILATLLVNLFVLATPLFTMNVYDRVIPNSAKETLMVFTIGVISVYIIDALLKYARSFLLEIAAKKSDIIMSSIVFERILDMRLSSHPKSVGSFASNLREFESIRSFLTNASMTALVDFPFSLIFLAVIYYIGGSIVVVPMVTIVIIFIYALIIRKPLAKSIEFSSEASARKNGVLIESLHNIETIKTHNMSSGVQYEYEEAAGEIAKRSLKSRMLSASIPTVTGFFIQINTVMVVFYGVYLIEDFEMSMGALIAVVILTSRTIAPMGQAAALITNYEDAKKAYGVIETMLAEPSERSGKKAFIQKNEIRGKIEFKNVSFSYDGEEKLALDNVSFVIEAGEKIAMIGRIGSGKSTIEKLILGLYLPTKGAILIDDIDIQQIDPAQLRAHISYVPQDIHLFRGDVRSNIMSRNRYADDMKMLRAAEVSGVADFVRQHPNGYAMAVGERGAGLSGGQRQSIGIARALLIDSPLYLFDEPTNAMDQLSEQRFIERLQKNLKSKTFLLVTQKMELLKLVERVIVMHEGKVILDGPRDEIVLKLQKAPHGEA